MELDAKENRRLTLHSSPLWAFLLVFGMRFLILTKFANSPHLIPSGGDMRFYSDWALRIVSGEFTDYKAFYGLPGYPFLLAAIYGVAGFNPFLVGVLQSVSEGLIGALIMKLAQFIAGIRPEFRRQASAIGWLAATGWAFLLPAQTFSIILMPTTWLVLAFWGTVWWLTGATDRSSWSPWLWIGLFVGAIAMVVATILFILPMAVAVIVLVFWKKPLLPRLKHFGLAAACLFAGVIVGTSPCWWHNYFVAREPVALSAHSGVNFWIGNNPGANGYPKIPPGLRAGQAGLLRDSITVAEEAAGRPLQRVEVSQYWDAKAKAYIEADPVGWLGLLALKFKNFWNRYQYDDLSLLTLLQEDGILLPGLTFGFVAALAAGGVAAGWHRFPRLPWVIAPVVLHMFALMPVFVTERYRLAAAPGLLLLAALFVVEVWQRMISRELRALAAPVVTAAAAAFFVSIPPADSGLWGLDHLNNGITRLEEAQGDPADRAEKLKAAERHLMISYRRVSNNAEVNFALGNLCLELGKREKAKQFYRRTLSLIPAHSGAWSNVGVLALEEKRWPLAESFFLNALVQEPDDAKTHYLLAAAQMEQGKMEEAGAALDRALSIRPEFKEALELSQRLQQRDD